MVKQLFTLLFLMNCTPLYCSEQEKPKTLLSPYHQEMFRALTFEMAQTAASINHQLWQSTYKLAKDKDTLPEVREQAEAAQQKHAAELHLQVRKMSELALLPREKMIVKDTLGYSENIHKLALQ